VRIEKNLLALDGPEKRISKASLVRFWKKSEISLDLHSAVRAYRSDERSPWR